MLFPTRGKILCKILSREKVLASGIILPDLIKSEKKDNFARVVGVGDPVIGKKGKKILPITRRGEWVHYKLNFGKKLTYNNENLIILKNDEIIAIEDEQGNLKAVGSMVIVKLVREDKIGSIILSDGAKLLEGDFYGEVISVGSDFPDKDLKKGDKVIYLRDEGYKFKGYNDREEYHAVKSCWCYATQT